MKLKLGLPIAIVVLLSISSCTKDHPYTSDISKEINVRGSIDGVANSGVKTRASDASWEDGDQIGVFMRRTETDLSSALAVNVPYTTDGSDSFTPVSSGILLPFQNEMVSFIAYYPYTASLDGLNYSIDVSDQSNLADIDLMYAYNEEGINSTTDVNLTFVHQLSKIDLSITMMAGGPGLNGLRVEITDINTKASFSLNDGSIINESESSPQNISFQVNGDGSLAQAILLPNKSLTNKKLVFTLGEISYSYNLSNATIEKFDKSTKYILKVNLKPGVGNPVVISDASIVDWTEELIEDIEAGENKK